VSPSATVSSTPSTRSSHRARGLGVDDRAVVECVVGHQQAAGHEPRHQFLVAVGVEALVCVDEGEVDPLTVGQSAQGPDGRGDPQVDPVGDPHLGPGLAGERGPLVGGVTGEEPAASGHRLGHGQGGEPGEGADLDDLPGTDQPDQEGRQRTLLLGNLQVRDMGQLLAGDLDEFALHGAQRRVVLEDVCVQLGRELRVLLHVHGLLR
jgi:hypothetical protein